MANGAGPTVESNGVMQSNGKHRNGSVQADAAIILKPQPPQAEVSNAEPVSTPKARPAPRASDINWRELTLQANYKPGDKEPFMTGIQRLYFRTKLLKWKEDIVRQNMETLKGLHDDSLQQADPADRATAETDRALELRARDRQRKLMGKIDAALGRIEEGSYGYCEETGDPISLKRLDARPIATLSLEAQERRERRERIFRDD